MNLSLRNLAMGAALAVSSFAFAQEMPFTVTENYNRLLTTADFGEGAGGIGGDIRTATGVNGKSYALDKGTGVIYAIDATTVTKYATVDVNRGEDNDHVMLDITSDDAGNLLVAYAAGDFFANALKGVAIVPADGSDVIYVDELEFPEGWVPGRVDVMGRIVGDMLSEDGAYFYLTGAGGANKVACYWISEGAFEVQEYTSDEYKSSGQSLTYAVPMYNYVAEQADVDPVYNGGILMPWNGSGPEMLVDGACVVLPRAEGLDYTAVPGGDVINYDGKLYYAVPYTTASGKRSGDFVITDETGAVYFKTTNGEAGGIMADLVNTGSFVNGGGLYIHPVAGETGIYELYWWGGFNQGVVCASYTITFPQPEKEAPFTVTNIYNRLMTGADFGVSALGGDIRTATGVKGHSYALDKGTGTIYAIDGITVTEYAKVDVNRGDDNDHVMLDITSDDAGNLLVAYAAGDFFANSLKGVAIVPADGGDVIYVDELEFPEGWAAGRVDVMGRIVGDMLSEDGAYLYLTGAGGANKVACYWISEGYFEPQEYTSDEYKTAGSSLTYAVPMYNYVSEQADVDPVYNGGVLFPWNGSGPEMLVDGACVTLPRAEGLAYSSTPGGDVINYDGKLYYAVPYTTASGKRSGDFVITDETGAVYFKTTNGEEGGIMADLVNTGSFVNGGGLYIHPLEGATGIYELYWWGGFNQGVVCAAYEIEFPGAVRPVTPPAEPARNAFAYGVNGTQEGTVVNITYTATAPALEAVLVLTDVKNAENVFEYDLPAPKVGVNEVAFAIPEDLPGSQYNWAVKLASANNETETPALVLEKVGDTSITWGRGGLVTITDPAYASYGYTVVANSRGLGMDVYNPEGDLVGNYKPEFPGTVGNSCPLRGDQRFGKAVFASWGDPNSGIYAYDPIAPEAGVKQLVEGERDGKGIFTYNGVQTASSTPCVAFVGKGEETMMWTFDEDIYANTIVGYPIGNAETLTVPASIVCDPETTGWNSASLMLNNAVCFEPAPNGLFSAQNRANGMDQGVPAFIYMDNNGELIAKAADLMEDANYELPSCNGAVALSVNADILAVGSYNGVHFFAVTWEDGEPVLEHIGDVEIATKTTWAQAKFDAGNNLHIAGVNTGDYTQQFYAVVSLPIVSEATTAAPAENVINNASGVESVEVEAAEAVYYNLNGVRVAADQLTPGVYVKVAGTKATKVVVK